MARRDASWRSLTGLARAPRWTARHRAKPAGIEKDTAQKRGAQSLNIRFMSIG